MFEISTDYGITLTRGDTATLEITITGDVPTASDEVIAALKRSASTKTALKEWTLIREDTSTEDAAKYLLHIASEDTDGLPFGAYLWDIRVLYADGQITTPFAAKAFWVTKVVTDLPGDGDSP